jgi:hypothetical protein
MIINDLYNNKKQGVAEGWEQYMAASLRRKHRGPQIATHRTLVDLNDKNDSLPAGSTVRQVEGSNKLYVHLVDGVPKNIYNIDKKHVEPMSMAEASLGDYRKKATVSQAGAKINQFFDRDDPAKVAAADRTIANRTKGLGRADARIKAYTPPAAAPVDLEKQQRGLTARYPNIDELVRRAELNRDPDYEMADGQAYYAARDAEQNYQKLRQIQRVIQGLNESLNRSHLP